MHSILLYTALGATTGLFGGFRTCAGGACMGAVAPPAPAYYSPAPAPVAAAPQVYYQPAPQPYYPAPQPYYPAPKVYYQAPQAPQPQPFAFPAAYPFVPMTTCAGGSCALR
jgi:hypothetical protein